LRFGFCLPHDGELSQPENLTDLSHLAEELGFDTLVEPSDHLVMPNKIQTTYPYSISGEYTDTTEDLDQATTLSYVAAKTDKIRLMTGISVVPYRNPLALANTFATIDYLSRGRLDFGAGTGWMKDEFDLLNVSYEERGEIMDENLRILRTVWSEKKPSFSGKYFHFKDVHFSPKVVQKPHPPIWVGGESPRAIRRAAELGDGWFPIDSNPNFPLLTVEQMSAGIAKLRRQVQKAGRNPEEVRIGYIAQNFDFNDRPVEKRMFAGGSHKIVRDIQQFEKLGVSFMAFSLLRENLEQTVRFTERFAEEIMNKLD
jgi:probable F420-dependent oxidoreductase